MQKTDTNTAAPLTLCRLIGHTRTAMIVGLEQALVDAGFDLNFTQFLALKWLGEHGPMGAGELARGLHYNPGALTRLLDKLEQAGWLERLPDPADRRALRLELTAAGDDVRRRMLDCVNRAADRLFDGMSRTDRTRLHDLLTGVLARLNATRQPTAAS